MAPNSPRARLGGLAVLLALCVLAAGCAGNKKITQANFEKIKNDMSLSEVEAILGPGDKQGDGSNVAAQAGVDVNMGAAPSSTGSLLAPLVLDDPVVPTGPLGGKHRRLS